VVYVDPWLETAWFQVIILVSKFAFKFNLYRYYMYQNLIDVLQTPESAAPAEDGIARTVLETNNGEGLPAAEEEFDMISDRVEGKTSRGELAMLGDMP
jgi:hypothetical protein